MPQLKQISCSIEVGNANIPLPEYGTQFSDGYVQAFIAVPEFDVPFTIHVKTHGYIGPGIAFFVFIDGEPHCNRNRVNLSFPYRGISPTDYEVEHRLRQKEEKTTDGTYLSREWSFKQLNGVTLDQERDMNLSFLKNVGTIEVVALRCHSDGDVGKGHHRLPQHPFLPKTEQSSAHTTSTSRRGAGQSFQKAQGNIETESGSPNGIFGLFDGSCETLSPSDVQQAACQLDGAGDYPWSRCTDLGSPLPKQTSQRETSHSRAWGDSLSDEMREMTFSSNETHEVDTETNSAFEELSLMKIVLHKLQQVLPDLDLSDWKQDILSCRAACHRVPAPRYERPAFDLDTLRLQREYVQNDRLRVKGFLSRTFNAMKGYRCPPLERILHERGRQQTLVKTAIFNAKFLEQIRDQQAQMESNGVVPKADGASGRDIAKKMPLPMRELEGLQRKPLPPVLYDIEFAALLLRQHETKKPNIRTAEVWALLHDWQDGAFANPEKPLPGQSAWGCRGGDPRDPQEWTDYIAQLNGRKTMIDEFCYSSRLALPSFDTFLLQEHSNKLSLQGRKLSEHIEHTQGSTASRDPQKSATSSLQHAGPQSERLEKAKVPGWETVGQGVVNRKQSTSYGDISSPDAEKEFNPWRPVDEQSQQRRPQDAWAGTAAKDMPDWEAADVHDKMSTRASDGNPFSLRDRDISDPWLNKGDAFNDPWGKTEGSKHSKATAKTRDHGWGLSNNHASHVVKDADGQTEAGGWDQHRLSFNASKSWGKMPAQAAASGWGGNEPVATAWSHKSQICSKASASERREGAVKQKSSSTVSAENPYEPKASGDAWTVDGKVSPASKGEWGDNAGVTHDAVHVRKHDDRVSISDSDKVKSRSARAHRLMQHDEVRNSPSTKRQDSFIEANEMTKQPKPYWSEWNKAKDSDSDGKRKQRNMPKTPYIYPSQPLPTVPEEKIQGGAFAVQAGRGADYVHLSRRPVYIDTMEAPYAVFTFKYRSKAMLEKILDIKIPDSDMQSIKEKIEKERYMNMPKHVLVDELLKNQQGREQGLRKGNTNGTEAAAANVRGSSIKDANHLGSRRDSPSAEVNVWATRPEQGRGKNSSVGTNHGAAKASGSTSHWKGKGRSKKRSGDCSSWKHDATQDQDGGCGTTEQKDGTMRW